MSGQDRRTPMVTEADREARDAIMAEVERRIMKGFEGHSAFVTIKTGNETWLFDILARHRTASTAALTAENQRLREDFARLFDIDGNAACAECGAPLFDFDATTTDDEETVAVCAGHREEGQPIYSYRAALSTPSEVSEPVADHIGGEGEKEWSAFKAGWRTNVVAENIDNADYLKNCEAGDYAEYQRLGLSAYLESIVPECPDATAPREAAVRAVAKIEMDREGYPLSRTQEEIYSDAAETVDAVLASISDLRQTEVSSKDGMRQVAGHVIDTAASCMAAYAALIDPIRAVAKRFGYAVAQHGSLARDIDLLAVPWTEDAVAPELLVEAIAELVKSYGGGSFGVIDRDCPRDKPHGRRAWSIHGWQFYIDLSVMPLTTPPNPTNGDAVREALEKAREYIDRKASDAFDDREEQLLAIIDAALKGEAKR